MMVKLNKIYTRGGDDGTTALADGARRPKHDARIACYGAIDEANAAIGIARLYTQENPDLDAILGRLQNDLFDLGADLATPDNQNLEVLRIHPTQVARLEQEIDTLNSALSPLSSFVLPGGTAAAAHLHMARTIIRRAERVMSAAMHRQNELFSDIARQFINRASDLLFVAARTANAPDSGNDNGNGKGDVLWQPAAHQKIDL